MGNGKERFSNLRAYSGQTPRIRVYRMPPTHIGYLTNIVEAYDGIGLVRTLDKERGIVELWIMPDFEQDFDLLLGSMRREFPMQQITAGMD